MSSQVRVKSKSGRIYVYEVDSFWNKEKKKTDSHRRCIGHIDEATGDLVPNRPKAKNGSVSKSEKPSSVFSVEGIGNYALIDKAAKETGLLECLKECFPVEWPYIMTCCQYLCGCDQPLCHAEGWFAHNVCYLGSSLPSAHISELLSSLGPDRQREFFRLWIRQNQAKEYFALDITSVSSYSELIGSVKSGYSHDQDPLPQINLLMIIDEKSQLPICFLPLAGKIKDVKALKSTIEDQQLIESWQLSVMMDKEFFFEANLDALYESKMRFAIGVPFSSGIAKEAIEKHRDSIESHQNMITVMDSEVYAATELQKWNNHRLYVHVYFDSEKAAGERMTFHKKLGRVYEQLVHGEPVEDEQFRDEYFIVTQTPVRGIKVKYNEEAIDRHLKGNVGWFILVSNFIKDSVEALTVYREKDSVEKSFDDLKNQLDMKKLRVHLKQAMNGRIFLQFLSLIVTAWICRKLSEAKWTKGYSYSQIMDEIGELKQVTDFGKRKNKNLVLTTTKLQDQIIELFELSQPYIAYV
ncbi:transposase [Erysipelotrichaceae bacterium 51-3]